MWGKFDHRTAMRRKPTRIARSRTPKKRFARRPVSRNMWRATNLLRGTAKSLRRSLGRPI